MRASGWRGVARARTVRTTVADPAHSRAPDLVKRNFTAPRPGQLHVADFTYVPLDGGGFGYTAFVIDAFAGLIAGWECSLSKETAFVERAIRQAAAFRARQGNPLDKAIHHSDAGSQGGFNRSSQHLQVEVGEWGDHAGGQLRGRGGRRCVRRVGLRWPGGRTGSGSGWRSPGECRVRTPALRLVCPRRSVRDGSVTAAGSGRSAWPRCRGGTCRWRSGRRSRSCGPGGAVPARSPGVPAGRRQRSRGSCAGTLRPGAAGWSTGPPRLSGTRTCGHGARRSRSSLRTRPCGSTCKTGSPARSPGPVARLCRARMCAGPGAGTVPGRIGAGLAELGPAKPARSSQV